MAAEQVGLYAPSKSHLLLRGAIEMCGRMKTTEGLSRGLIVGHEIASPSCYPLHHQHPDHWLQCHCPLFHHPAVSVNFIWIELFGVSIKTGLVGSFHLLWPCLFASFMADIVPVVANGALQICCVFHVADLPEGQYLRLVFAFDHVTGLIPSLLLCVLTVNVLPLGQYPW